jgi:TRAP-type C4-dicarboxylate transport system permease small subunit
VSYDLFERFLRLLAYMSGILILLLVVFTVTDVFLRYVFNAPLKSVYEFTEFIMAAIVFLGVAYTGWVGGHIAVDVFAKWLDQPALRFVNALIAFAGAALFALISYRATLETTATITQVSNRLGWPHYPFRYTVAFGCALFAIVLFLQGARALRAHPTEERKNDVQ